MAIALSDPINSSQFIQSLIDKPYHDIPKGLPPAVSESTRSSFSISKVLGWLVSIQSMQPFMPQLEKSPWLAKLSSRIYEVPVAWLLLLLLLLLHRLLRKSIDLLLQLLVGPPTWSMWPVGYRSDWSHVVSIHIPLDVSKLSTAVLPEREEVGL